jgi:GT2 family glycosyltransferase
MITQGDTKVQLSFCIVSLNARKYLVDCINSLIESNPPEPYEIIVVDNNSSDGTFEMLRQDFSQIIALRNNSNLGYTVPMNQAMRKAQGHYIIQLNPDTLTPQGAFQTLWEYMETHSEVGICTPKVLNRDGTLQLQCRRSAARPWDVITYFTRLARLFPKNRLYGRYLMTYMDENETHEVEAVSGSCMVIRREVIEQIGYLDELFFAYQEDADFCFRARKASWKIIFLPTAQITHYGGEGGSRSHPYRAILEWHRSYFRYYRKNLAREYFFLFNWFYYALMSAKLCAALLIAFFQQKKQVGTKKP